MLIRNFEGREAKGLSKGRYDETFDGEDVKVITEAPINISLLFFGHFPTRPHPVLFIDILINLNEMAIKSKL